MTVTEKDKRRIGYEYEFAGLTLEDVGRLVVEFFGGRLESVGAFEMKVTDSEHGEFRLECDSTFLKDKIYADWIEKVGVELSEETSTSLDDILANHSDILVPRELITPPIPIREFKTVEKFTDRLQDLYQNQGGRFSVAPCGLHLNVECARLDTSYLLNTLRAFCILYDSLLEEGKVDWSRRLAPYIKGFPQKYVDLILDKTYDPTEQQFVSDYFEHNPTRNRGLDMSVIFASLNSNYIEDIKGLETHLIKARPAFHYRLPNCDLGDSKWSISEEVERWFKLENLARELEGLASDPQLKNKKVSELEPAEALS